MEAIVISGMPAAGKTTLCKILSKRLNIPWTSGSDILKEMAVERGYKPGGDDWWDTPDGMKFLREREGDPEFDEETDRRLAKKIEEGNIVISTYTTPWIVAKGFKVWLDASSHIRAERMTKRDNTAIQHSERVISTRDRENHKLYMELYGIDMGNDKSPFDIVVETDKLTSDEVADVVINSIKNRK